MKKITQLFRLLIAAIIIISVQFATSFEIDLPYEQLDYDGLRVKLLDLANKFPTVLNVTDSEKKVNVPYLYNCDSADTTKCVLDIVTITDSKTPSNEKV